MDTSITVFFLPFTITIQLKYNGPFDSLPLHVCSIAASLARTGERHVGLLVLFSRTFFLFLLFLRWNDVASSKTYFHVR